MDRPKVVVYGEVSVDGRLTPAPDVLLLFGDERWNSLAGKGHSYNTLLQVYKPQAFLEGSLSLVRQGDDPEPLPEVVGSLDAYYSDYLPDEVVKRPNHRGWFVMVDSRGRVRWGFKEWPDEAWAGWHAMVLVAYDTPAAYLAYLQREKIPYLVAGRERVDLALALHKLKTRLGVERVISTSPGKLGGALLRCDLLDEVYVDFFPAIIGGERTPTLFQSPDLLDGEWPARLKLESATVEAGGRVALHYSVVH